MNFALLFTLLIRTAVINCANTFCSTLADYEQTVKFPDGTSPLNFSCTALGTTNKGKAFSRPAGVDFWRKLEICFKTAKFSELKSFLK